MRILNINLKDNSCKVSTLTLEGATQPAIIWHYDPKDYRVVFPIDIYDANIQKLLAHNLGLESHPFLDALVTKVQTGKFIRVDADGMVYYYCVEVCDDDVDIIINYGGYIESKPV